MATLKDPVNTNDHIQGNKNAAITLLEYGDLECPYCRMADIEVKKLQADFKDNFRFVFRHFPLAEAHPHAFVAAETSEFAAESNLFWEMHDLIYKNQDRLSMLGIELLYELTESLQLSVSDLKIALQEKKYYDKIRHDFLGGVKSGVNGTPAFYINGRRHDGSYEAEVLKMAMQAQK